MSDSNLRHLDTPAGAQLRGMLNQSMGAEIVADYLVKLRGRADAAADKAGFVISVYGEGNGSIVIGGRYFGGLFEPLPQAFADAEAWLARDTVAETHLTLGLSADGRFIDASQEAAAE